MHIINACWFYVCPCLLSFCRSLKPEKSNVINQGGIVKIRMYSNVRNCELLKKIKVLLILPETGIGNSYYTCLVRQRLCCCSDIILAYPDFENVSNV